MNTSHTSMFRTRSIVEDTSNEAWAEYTCKRITQFNKVALVGIGAAFAWYVVEVVKELMK